MCREHRLENLEVERRRILCCLPPSTPAGCYTTLPSGPIFHTPT